MKKGIKTLAAGILFFLITLSQASAMGILPEGSQGGKGSTGGLGMFLPLILIFVIFYFLMIMPQRQQRKKHKEMIDNLQRGARVVTSGGIHGTINKIDKDTVVLKVSDRAEIVVDKSVIARVKG